MMCDIENEQHDGNTVIEGCRICEKSYCEICGDLGLKVHKFHLTPEELKAIKEGRLLIEDLIVSKRHLKNS